jgi:hypothetical protein
LNALFNQAPSTNLSLQKPLEDHCTPIKILVSMFRVETLRKLDKSIALVLKCLKLLLSNHLPRYSIASLNVRCMTFLRNRNPSLRKECKVATKKQLA